MLPVEPSLLLLIPAYNEEDRIGPVLRRFAGYYRTHYRGEFKLVVVLNGCRDGTRGVVEAVMKEHSCVHMLVFDEPIGKGGALIKGLEMEASTEWVGYVDADGATSPEAFHELVKLHSLADCIIGSRWLEGSVLHQEQSTIRQFTSRVFHGVVEVMFGMGIMDTQCPAKLIRGEAVQAVLERLTTADLAFDVNLLFSLKRAGFSIREVATEWTDMMGSKVTEHLFRTSLTMFLSVVRLRLIYSPLYRWLAPLRPLETWLYAKLRAPMPISDEKRQ